MELSPVRQHSYPQKMWTKRQSWSTAILLKTRQIIRCTMEECFAGAVKGYGLIQKYTGGVHRRFTVDMHGMVNEPEIKAS